jgi:4-alpha-glucanotransferase
MTQDWSQYYGYGVLLHLTALPSEQAMGDLGPSSYKFLDWLQSIEANTWQVLPTGITDETHCPYACYSAFGGNPLLISLDILKDESKLIDNFDSFQNTEEEHLNFDKIAAWKEPYLKEAFLTFNSNPESETFKQFREEEKYWLEDLALFLVLTDEFGHDWSLWPSNLSVYQSSEVERYKEAHQADIDYQVFLQFIFNKQWMDLKREAENKGIQIFGDIPIFVSFHSMEVWKFTHLFKLSESNTLEMETGAPPDAFNDQGQKWGTPNYNWSKMKENNFSWWVERIRYQAKRFHLLRLDHFLGFINVWESPKVDNHSLNGKWIPTPGDELFSVLKSQFPNLPLIAEDLGETNDAVFALRDKYQFPGMKILQFAFGENADQIHHPHNITKMSITYTGTHDNNTFCGHLNDLDEKKQAFTDEINSLSKEEKPAWALIDIALKTNAILAIFPIQDILELGPEARFNTPGTISKLNWSWRLDKLPSEMIGNKIKNLAQNAGRSN